jgi:hypothetical protein
VKSKINFSKGKDKEKSNKNNPGAIEDFFPEENGDNEGLANENNEGFANEAENNEVEDFPKEEINEDLANEENNEDTIAAGKKKPPQSKNVPKTNNDKFKMISKISGTLGKSLETAKKKANIPGKRKTIVSTHLTKFIIYMHIPIEVGKNPKPTEGNKIIISTKEIFKDEEFPAHVRSITLDESNQNYNKYFLNAKWLRPPEIFKCSYDEIKLFDTIDPNDINQGALGNCYFLATLSALAEFPDRVMKVFNNKTINPSGAYSVTLYIQGIPKEIVVDDCFPCLNNQPLFAKPVGKELWVMILEKAWAKCFKQYTIAEGGLPHQAMEHIVGAPTKGFSSINQTKGQINLFEDLDELGRVLKESDEKGYLLSAGTKGTGESKSEEGKFLL